MGNIANVSAQTKFWTWFRSGLVLTPRVEARIGQRPPCLSLTVNFRTFCRILHMLVYKCEVESRAETKPRLEGGWPPGPFFLHLSLLLPSSLQAQQETEKHPPTTAP